MTPVPRLSNPNERLPVPSDAALPEADEGLPIPIVTIGLMVVLVGIYAAMWRAGHGNIPAVAALFGDKENNLVAGGQYWRLLTAMFLHGSGTHLAVNGISLLWLGIQIERIYGSRKFFLIYVAAGLFGNLFSFAFTSAPSLGASGAIFGLLGAGLIFPLRFSVLLTRQERSSILRQIVPIVAINLAINFTPVIARYTHIDQWAHLGGLVGGGIMALFLVPDALDPEPVRPVRNALLWLFASLTFALLLWAGLMQWRWAHAQTLRFASNFTEYNRGKDTWWSFKLPTRWQDVGAQGGGRLPRGVYFTEPSRAVIRVLDSQQVDDLDTKTQMWMFQQNAPVQRLNVDGKPGQRVIAREGDRIMELCEVMAYGQEAVFELECAPRNFARCHADFEFMLSSARFIHPPAALRASPPRATPIPLP